MRGWRRYVRQRVVVNLLSDRAISGVLYRQEASLLVLKDATIHEPGADPVSADGEIVVELRNVDYIQIVG